MWPVNWVTCQRKLNTPSNGAWHGGEREAGLSPLTEVMSTVQQDGHAVHSEDPDGEQADGTNLESRGEVGMMSHRLTAPTPGPLSAWVLGPLS